jgi:hypothetical protein
MYTDGSVIDRTFRAKAANATSSAQISIGQAIPPANPDKLTVSNGQIVAHNHSKNAKLTGFRRHVRVVSFVL